MSGIAGLIGEPSFADAAGPARLAPAPEEVRAFSDSADIAPGTAREALALQSEAVALPQELEDTLGAGFAGLWFDDDRAEFVIPTLSRQGTELVDSSLPIAADDYRVEPASVSWDELEEAQETLMAGARSLPVGSVRTSLNARSNSLTINLSTALPAASLSRIESAAAELGVPTEVARLAPAAMSVGNLAIGPGGCDNVERICPTPIRGGVAWGYPGGSGTTTALCTAGFPAIGSAGNRFMITAAHCLTEGQEWRAAWGEIPAAEHKSKEIGPLSSFEYGLEGDFALFKTNGTPFDQGSREAVLSVWGENENYPILSEGSSYLGQPICHTGRTTGTSCNVVEGVDVSFFAPPFGPGGSQVLHEHMTETGAMCVDEGDSGGPVFSGHTAFGIVSAATILDPVCQRHMFFTEITRVSARTGTHVAAAVGQKPAVKIPSGIPNHDYSPSFSGSTTILKGVVRPNGISTTYRFEYGPTSGYGGSTAAVNVGAGFLEADVEAAVPGLQGSTLYHYRLTAENTAGAVFTEDHQFTTPAFPPAISGVSATPGKLSLTLKATIAPLGNATTYRFEYGHTAAYGSSVPVPDGSMIGDNLAHEVSQTLGEVEGTYHYRVAATNAGGTTYSPDAQVYVQERPTIVAEAATTHLGATAELNGQVNPHGVATTYYFEYGATTSYGSKTAETSAGAGAAAVKVSAALSGLGFGQNRHFRLVAANSAGTRLGPDLTFTPGWEQSAVQPTGGLGDGFEGVSCAAVATCVAVGNRVATEEAGGGTIVGTSAIWNGADWEERLTPNPANAKWVFLQAASCPTGGTACEAFGYYLTTASEYRLLAERWNGSGWELQSTPNPAGTGLAFFEGGSCASASLCFGVGRAVYASPSIHVGALIERWNGTAWTEVAAPAPAGSKESVLLSASCPTATFCAALGAYVNEAGEGGYFVDRWNGTAWSAEALPKPPGTGAEAGTPDVSCTSASFCEMVGSYVEAGTPRLFSERWNGTKWEVATFAAPANAAAKEFAVEGLACPTTSVCEAVGTLHEVGENTPAVAFVERWNGTKWEEQVLPRSSGVAAGWLHAVACANETTCMAIGEYSGEGNPRGLAEAHVKTPAAAAVTTAATAIGKTGATLNGTVNPRGAETKYRFEYGTTAAYGSLTTEASAGAGTTAKAVSAAITGLAAGTRYHFRVRATSAAGTTYGRDLSFETAPEGTAKSLAALPLTDTLSNPETHYASWTVIPWATGTAKKGFPGNGGWRTGNAPLNVVAGMSWGPLAADSGAGEAAIVSPRTGTMVEGESFSLWLDSPATPSSRTGYQLTLLRSAGTDLYKVTLSRWSAGAQTVLAEKTGVSVANLTPVALVDQGNSVSVWLGTETSFNQLLAVTDSTFSGGTTLLEGTGDKFWLFNLKFGGLT